MPHPKPIEDDPNDESRHGPHLEIFTHAFCQHEGEGNARAAVGIICIESGWADIEAGELVPPRIEQSATAAAYWAIIRALTLSPPSYDLTITTHNELAANTLQLCLREREDHGGATTTLPRQLHTCWLHKKFSHSDLIARILQAVQTREREHCWVKFEWCGVGEVGEGEREEGPSEAKILALAALEPIESCDSSENEGEDKQEAQEEAEEEKDDDEEEEEQQEDSRRKSKKRKIIKGEGEAEDSTASRESSPGAEE